MIIRKFGVLAALALVLAQTTSVWAHGSIAVGQTNDVAKDGLAIGYTWNYSDKGSAEADALKQCLSFQDAPDRTRALCKVVQDFQNECLAVSLDPAAGTEGFGWAVSSTDKQASARALQTCRDTDGPDHQADCKVTAVKCDGK